GRPAGWLADGRIPGARPDTPCQSLASVIRKRGLLGDVCDGRVRLRGRDVGVEQPQEPVFQGATTEQVGKQLDITLMRNQECHESMTPWSAYDPGGEPVCGILSRAAGSPAELQPCQDLSQLLLDFCQLQGEVALTAANLGSVAASEHRE